MRGCVRNLKCIVTVSLLLGLIGCSASPPDQFKPISDRKKAQLTHFLASKQSRLMGYKATVTEEADVERRTEATHVGLIEFDYVVTKPVGEHESQGMDTMVAEYRFSAKERKWVYKGCHLKLSGTLPFDEKERLVTIQEVVAAFEK
jgi:hypothetical protein